jgi:hypothetical protein
VSRLNTSPEPTTAPESAQRFTGAVWDAYMRSVVTKPATAPYFVFLAGYEAGLEVCTRPCCNQTTMDLRNEEQR